MAEYRPRDDQGKSCVLFYDCVTIVLFYDCFTILFSDPRGRRVEQPAKSGAQSLFQSVAVRLSHWSGKQRWANKGVTSRKDSMSLTDTVVFLGAP